MYKLHLTAVMAILIASMLLSTNIPIFAKGSSHSGTGGSSIGDPKQFFSMSGSESVMSSSAKKVIEYDVQKHCAPSNDLSARPNPSQYLTYFNCGHVSIADNGSTTRAFSLVIREDTKVPITLPNKNGNSIVFPGWTFNGTIPGPTMRMTQGDHVKITVINQGTMPHTLHMHSIHPGAMDGVPMLSDSGMIQPGQSFTYDFIAMPAGVYPYHCHADPIAVHINHGLYGAMIIDPPVEQARPPMQEMVFFLNGYSLKLNEEGPRLPTIAEANQMMHNASNTVELPAEHDNDIYTMNGVALYYTQHRINLTTGENVRAYVVNMLDFEENSLHIHGTLFKYFPSGTNQTAAFTNDVISLSQGDRGIMEFVFPYPGEYMMHAHIDQIASRGWMSVFHVAGPDAKQPVSPATHEPVTLDKQGRCSGSNCK